MIIISHTVSAISGAEQFLLPQLSCSTACSNWLPNASSLAPGASGANDARTSEQKANFQCTTQNEGARAAVILQ